MKLWFLTLMSIGCFSVLMAQNAAFPSGTFPPSTNISAAQYPRLDEQGRGYFQLRAPQAKQVQLDLGKMYDMVQSPEGVWSVTTEALEPGFHYYSLLIDGVRVADPASESFFGTGRMSSAIDVPEKGVDFYTIKEVPHGGILIKSYYSSTTNSWRKMHLYLPPGYDANAQMRYPVVYIQHGGGEDERGWSQQGKTDVILDNLIASGRAKPMIVVMTNGNVSSGRGGYSIEAMSSFADELTKNIVPFVDKQFRTIANRSSRALCGLSMGGGQAFYVGLTHLDVFASIGIFSSGIFGGINSAAAFDGEKEMPGLLTKSASFNEKLDLFYISCGTGDPRFSHTQKAVETFKNKGLKVQFSGFPGGHEWQVWRKSVHDFAQMLFK